MRRSPDNLLRLALMALVLLSGAACHSPKYVHRVYWHRGADYEDIHKFDASVIEAPASAWDLPVVSSSHVARVMESHDKIVDFGVFLEATETCAFLAVHHDTLVAEHYLRDNTQHSMQNTFSVSKSVMSALVGLAVRDSVLDLDAPITQYIPELLERDERFAEIHVDDLLYMRSGIKYSRKTSFPFVGSDDPLIYYHPDLQSVVLKRTKIASKPGEFKYNNYNPPLIGLILRRTTGSTVSAYLEKELWKPMGAEMAAGWTVDDHGFERMESGFHACGRDLARFGLLFLRGGNAGVTRVIPEEWVAESTRLPEPVEIETFNGRSWVYNAGWWLVPRESGPSDYCAIGAKGQYIYVSPQYNVVFIRNGPGRGELGDFDWTELFYYAAERL